MRIVDIQHKDIHMLVDFSLRELRMLRDLFGCAEINYNSEEDPEMVEAVNYLEKYFYPFLDKMVKDYSGEDGEEQSDEN
jgi:hypothetical protein